MWAKDILLKVVPSKIANDFVKKYHYSWKVVTNSQLHFWVFINNVLWWVMSYWPSTDKSKIIWLIKDTWWNEFIELNRMAFSDILPKNSESRAIAISIRLIKKQAPHIKWIISFADGCQCWDGTIYRAAWFELSQIKENSRLVRFQDWVVAHWLSLATSWYIQQKYNPHKITEKKLYHQWVFEYIKWYMFRYIKHLKPWLVRNYQTIPYSKIKEIGAGMYMWEKRA